MILVKYPSVIFETFLEQYRISFSSSDFKTLFKVLIFQLKVTVKAGNRCSVKMDGSASTRNKDVMVQ